MTKLILWPGGLICDAVGLTEDSDNRQNPANVPEHADLGRGGSDHDAAYLLNSQGMGRTRAMGPPPQ